MPVKTQDDMISKLVEHLTNRGFPAIYLKRKDKIKIQWKEYCTSDKSVKDFIQYLEPDARDVLHFLRGEL